MAQLFIDYKRAVAQSEPQQKREAVVRIDQFKDKKILTDDMPSATTLPLL
eukprot:COSAG02_NODE_509_length_20882_cov_71.811914_2_plen_50_part_00